MAPSGTDHLTLWDLGPQRLTVDFTAGRVVSDAGLLAVRALERPLRVIADLAPLLPDPRSPDFIRHRAAPPAEVILDVDATDDPAHGWQALSGYHGYFRQHQYFPLHVFEGHTGFPLAVWLRHGTAHASLGAADVLRPLVARLRAS